uniref:Uncharacterized protein n=1 Tax=Toxoplasma gondii COUG TaxID=1074873 RepID=A0A2G8YC69_TOXGO|nr:hypothetical protein TGCOUG_217810 [Toxoplasma gondii COUG]
MDPQNQTGGQCRAGKDRKGKHATKRGSVANEQAENRPEAWMSQKAGLEQSSESGETGGEERNKGKEELRQEKLRTREDQEPEKRGKETDWCAAREREKRLRTSSPCHSAKTQEQENKSQCFNAHAPQKFLVGTVCKSSALPSVFREPSFPSSPTFSATACRQQRADRGCEGRHRRDSDFVKLRDGAIALPSPTQKR